MGYRGAWSASSEVSAGLGRLENSAARRLADCQKQAAKRPGSFLVLLVEERILERFHP